MALFGKRRRRKLVERVRGEIAEAMAVLFYKLQLEWLADQPERERQFLAAALANRMGDAPFQAMHAEVTTPREVEVSLSEIMQADPLIRELVVQTLRMKLVADHAMEPKTSDPMRGLDDPLLQALGPQIPDTPDPRTYSALVAKVRATLPAEALARLDVK